MENSEIARILNEIADLLEIKGDNPFRIRSYRNAALTIENLPFHLETMVREDESRLDEIPRIGKGLHEKIVEIVNTGRCRYHEDLLKEIPHSLLDLLRISGLGPKKVQTLWKELGVTSIDDLERVLKAGLIKKLPGMGAKTEEKILRSLEEFKKRMGRFKLATALTYAQALVSYLRELDGIYQVEPAGSLRRRKDTIGDIDILVTCRKGVPVMERFVNYREVREVLAKGDTKSSVILKCGIQTDLRVLSKESFGAALHYFTGSKNHNIAIRERARKRGLKISEYGIFREDTGERIGGEREEDVFRSVGLPFIAPELRENRGEIEAAEEGRLPKLIELRDIKGDLQIHTRESDGANTIEEMAASALEMGYQYIAITEHSKAVSVAKGLDEGRVLEHMKRIEEVDRRFKEKGLRVLKGIEVDILPSGDLDLDGEVLKRLDIVVGAVHSKFNMTKEEMTERVIRAIETGLIDILAHPTGRLIGEREPYPIDMERVMDVAKRFGVIMELNAYPDRLDLNDIHCKLAKDKGVMVAISTDSHNRMHLWNMKYGIYTARRGWLEKEDVLNTRSYTDLLKVIEERRGLPSP